MNSYFISTEIRIYLLLRYAIAGCHATDRGEDGIQWKAMVDENKLPRHSTITETA